MRAGIALGSNLGDSSIIIKEAIGHLKVLHLSQADDFLASSLHKTSPIDCPPNSPAFLNGVVELETALEPLELLYHLQGLEEVFGRPKKHAYHAPRTLDLDLLYCDMMALSHPDLELPHPRILERPFVLAPLAEIRPDLQLPGWSKPCAEYLHYKSNNLI